MCVHVIYVYKYITIYTSVCLNIYLNPCEYTGVGPIGAIINNGKCMEPLKSGNNP